jgi:hypothetical protein
VCDGSTLTNNTLSAVWQAQIGSLSSEDVRGIAVDGLGNVYVTGIYSGTITGLNSHLGVGDIFINKYDSNGNILWQKSIQSEGKETPTQIAYSFTDDTLVITGYSGSSIDLDPGVSSLNSSGRGTFLIKLNGFNGTVNNATSWQSGIFFSDIDIDSSGNIYLSGAMGSFDSNGGKTFDLDPGVSTFTKTTVGYSDGVAIKLASNLAFTWGNAYGKSGYSSGFTAASLDLTNRLRVIGSESMNSPTSAANTVANRSAWIHSIATTDGSFQGSNDIYGMNGTIPLDIAVGTDNASYVCGVDGVGLSSTTIAARAVSSVVSADNIGTSTLFLTKIDSNGIEGWKVMSTSWGSNGCYGLEIDTANSVYITGEYQGTLNLGTQSIESVGGSVDGYLAKVKTDGTIESLKSFGSYQTERPQRMTSNGTSIFLSGWFNGNLKLVPTGSTMSSKGNADGFVARFD